MVLQDKEMKPWLQLASAAVAASSVSETQWSADTFNAESLQQQDDIILSLK